MSSAKIPSIFLSLIVALCAVFSPGRALAAKEYTTDYHSVYRLLPSGKTEVTHGVSIKNNLANIYATDYTIVIGASSLETIEVKDESGSINPEISVSENQTKISFPLGNPAIGKDAIKNIVISYVDPDVVTHAGLIWEINIPRLSNASDIDKYVRELRVPLDFAEASLMLPEPKVEEDEQSRIYIWEGNKTESITLFFGAFQLYRLGLKYTLTNPTLQSIETEIAIPPDTEYQRITIGNITPPPQKIVQDPDGNWLGVYSLEKQQKLGVSATLYAKVSALPTFELKYPSDNKNFSNLTNKTKYWNYDSSSVSTLAKQLKTPRNIYSYLVDTFTYNYSRVTSGGGRLGAEEALKNPTLAICTEFTDAFIALARASGIPAREINGFAFTSNPSLRPVELTTDVLHAWPEYYDKELGSWIQLDPTWGNTTGGVDYFSKLDFNHIAFVRRGLEDNYPYPAGAYKETPDKSVQVEIVSVSPEEKLQIEVIRQGDTTLLKNTGNVSALNYTVSLDGKDYTIAYLPPYGVETVSSNQLSLDGKKVTYLAEGLLGLVLVTLVFGLIRTVKARKKNRVVNHS